VRLVLDELEVGHRLEHPGKVSSPQAGNAAPTHTWIPFPKVRWVFAFPRSIRKAWNPDRTLMGHGCRHQHGVDDLSFAIACPPMAVSSMAMRWNAIWTGAWRRRVSSVAADARLGSARSLSISVDSG